MTIKFDLSGGFGKGLSIKNEGNTLGTPLLLISAPI